VFEDEIDCLLSITKLTMTFSLIKGDLMGSEVV
jgi:hypothetical protein